MILILIVIVLVLWHFHSPCFQLNTLIPHLSTQWYLSTLLFLSFILHSSFFILHSSLSSFFLFFFSGNRLPYTVGWPPLSPCSCLGVSLAFPACYMRLFSLFGDCVASVVGVSLSTTNYYRPNQDNRTSLVQHTFAATFHSPLLEAQRSLPNADKSRGHSCGGTNSEAGSLRCARDLRSPNGFPHHQKMGLYQLSGSFDFPGQTGFCLPEQLFLFLLLLLLIFRLLRFVSSPSPTSFSALRGHLTTWCLTTVLLVLQLLF